MKQVIVSLIKEVREVLAEVLAGVLADVLIIVKTLRTGRLSFSAFG